MLATDLNRLGDDISESSFYSYDFVPHFFGVSGEASRNSEIYPKERLVFFKVLLTKVLTFLKMIRLSLVGERFKFFKVVYRFYKAAVHLDDHYGSLLYLLEGFGSGVCSLAGETGTGVNSTMIICESSS